MDVRSTCPLGVASRVWASAHGGCTLTVVCKAIFRLAPGESPLHDQQESPNEEDTHWDDDPRRSLSAASDLAPLKPRADVVLVGSAFAPGGQPARSIVARMIVGEIDKSLEAFCDRAFRLSGEMVEGARVTQVSLRYERAGGGPGTWNPVGVRADADPDSYGLVLLPNIQPPGLHVAYRGDFIEPAGFGPIAPWWPDRAQKIGPNAAGFRPDRWYERPFPPGFDPAFFNVAPRDQQVSEIRSNERIVLENLHRDHPRLATSLPGLTPIAIAERANGRREPVALTLDTLSIDTARGVCSLVWRGWVRLSHPEEAGRVVVSLGGSLGAHQSSVDPKGTMPIAPRAGQGPAVPFTSAIDPKATLPASPRAGAGPATPFVHPSLAPRATDHDHDGGRPPIPPGSADPPQPRAPYPGAGKTRNAEALAPARAPLPFQGQEGPDLQTIETRPIPKDLLPPVAAVVPPMGHMLSALAYQPAIPGPIIPSVPQPSTPLEPAPPPLVPPATPPEPPPLVGPLAKVEMPLPDAEARPGESPSAMEPIAAPREPEPRDFPVERCGALTAAIAMNRPATAEILKAEGLTPARWEAITKHWSDAIRDEQARGKSALRNAFDAGYVGAVEERRGPIQVAEYARLVVATERGAVGHVVGELGIPTGAPMRIERVWTAKMVADPAFGRRVREAIEAEREG